MSKVAAASTPSPRKIILFEDDNKALGNVISILISLPPKTLHTFLLERVRSASTDQIDALTTLLEGVKPPTLLHCARCHKNYLEEDNYERSCVMDHNDDSADVQWVGRGRGGQEYETTWGCCGQSVEGEGDMGGPPGWCFEGKHTTSRKQARYREDCEDDEDDGLESCKSRGCKKTAEKVTTANHSRKRSRSSTRETKPVSKRRKISE